MILAQSGRPETLDVGVGDLLTVVAEKLSFGEETAREDAALLWRICGGGKGRRVV